MNCQECGRLLYANQAKCACGWKVPPRRSEPSPARPEDPQSSALQARKKFAKKLIEVDNYVARYLAANRGASRKGACFAYMRENGLLHILPTHMRDEEAIAEREAIQQEEA